jgi:hypothetical protein
VVFIYTMSGLVRDGRVNRGGRRQYLEVQSGWVVVEGGGVEAEVQKWLSGGCPVTLCSDCLDSLTMYLNLSFVLYL